MRVQNEVRRLLLNFPAKAAGEPEAIPILINGALPDDVNFQLQVCDFRPTQAVPLLFLG